MLLFKNSIFPLYFVCRSNEGKRYNEGKQGCFISCLFSASFLQMTTPETHCIFLVQICTPWILSDWFMIIFLLIMILRWSLREMINLENWTEEFMTLSPRLVPPCAVRW